jgi:hypothetical protein
MYDDSSTLTMMLLVDQACERADSGIQTEERHGSRREPTLHESQVGH